MDHLLATARLTSTAARKSTQAYPESSTLAHRNGLELPRRLPFDEWLGIGKHLSELNSSSAWCLGDWLAYGMEAFTGRYRNALEETSLDYQTLRNYVWVAKRFPFARRRVTLSFGHHAEVAALAPPEQDFWLRKAEEFRWSVKQLRQEVRASLREREAESRADAGEQDPELVQLSIRIGPDQLKACQTAATKVGLDIEEWVVLALARAAENIPSANP